MRKPHSNGYDFIADFKIQERVSNAKNKEQTFFTIAPSSGTSHSGVMPFPWSNICP